MIGAFSKQRAAAWNRIGAGVTAVFLFSLLGLALSRILYEALFPRALWLAYPLPVFLLAGGTAVGGLLLWRQLGTDWTAALLFLPALLNLGWLTLPNVLLIRSRFLFGVSCWLVGLLVSWLVRSSMGNEQLTMNNEQLPFTNYHLPFRNWLWLLLLLAPTYLLTLGQTVGAADTFEFQVVIPRLQIAHPTGYPLYILLSKPFTWLPFGSVAWRVNLATAVYALLAVLLLYELMRRLTGHELAALGTAVLFGLSPTFWSQAVAAEVYTLHALIVTAILFTIREILDLRFTINDLRFDTETTAKNPFSIFHLPFLIFLLGLGLTNHLTTIILTPAIALTLLFTFRQHRSQFTIKNSLLMIAALLLPLLLYAYLPLRWQMIHGQPMGFGNFIDWVIGGRFQDALQLMAWWRDPARYAVVGRLFRAEWGGAYLFWALLGLGVTLWRNWRLGLILLLTGAGFTFYALNYYVPDLNVFLIPAHLIIAILIGLALSAAFKLLAAAKARWQFSIINYQLSIFLLLLFPLLLTAATTIWPRVDQSKDTGLTQWGEAVLQRPLAPNAAILADSEKIAPLYYLQQAEGMRPDLDIMVLPDEAAYRAELDQRIAAGQTVYLARFLPGLAGIYHLRSEGPLTEVSTEPLTTLPPTAVATSLTFDAITLRGYELAPVAASDDRATAITLYWQANSDVRAAQPLHVFVRWMDGNPINPTGQHPANDFYPTNGWKGAEIVPDFHLLPHPINPEPQTPALQVALAPAFTAPDQLEWQTVTEVDLPATGPLALERPLRAQVGDALLSGISYPAQVRPQTEFPVIVTGYGNPIEVTLTKGRGIQYLGFPFRGQQRIDYQDVSSTKSLSLKNQVPVSEQFKLIVDQQSRYYHLELRYGNIVCGWLRVRQNGCLLGEIEVSGVPLPTGATNFADKIALLDITIEQTTLQPGGQLPLTFTWQGLAPLTEDYTLFIQVLDEDDRIVGQIDSWPLQGTYPTSQWTPGETLTDPYTVQLSEDLPPGQYRLIAGWYLLANGRRLPVLDGNGNPIDDKIIRPGLSNE